MFRSRFSLRTATLALAVACLAVASSVALAVCRTVYDLGHALVATIAPPLKGAPLLLKLAAVLQSMKAQAVSASKPVVMARWRMCPSV